MNARKLGFILGLLGSVAFAVKNADALGRAGRLATPTYHDAGSGGVLFSVACSSIAWTAVPSSTDTIRREIVYQTDENALASVCLATTTNSNDQCGSTTPGVKLSTGASLTDYSGIQFYCRARTAGPAGTAGSVNVFGYWTRDAGDFGAVNLAR